MGRGTPIRKGRGRGMFARKPGKGITLEMYIRNTQVNKKKKRKKKENIIQREFAQSQKNTLAIHSAIREY